MSVLDSIRRGTDSTAMRLVFGAIVVVFVFWGVGSGAGPTGQSVAEVNGERISDEDFRRARQQRTDGMSLSDDEQLKAIEREVLDSLVRSEVLRQEAMAAGLEVSDDEVLRELARIEAFRDESGAFSSEVYQRFLKRAKMTQGRFEESLREDILLRKFLEVLKLGAALPDPDLRRRYESAMTQVGVSWVRIPDEALLSAVPVDDAAVDAALSARPAEIKASYDKDFNRRWSKPKQAQVSRILLRSGMGSADVALADLRARADQIVAQARGGADFAQLALRWSEDLGTLATNGDAGALSAADLGETVAAVVFAASPGAVTDPIETARGVEIFLVRAITPEEVTPLEQAQRTIARELLAREGVSTFGSTLAEQVLARWKADGVPPADLLSPYGVTVSTAPPSPRSQPRVIGAGDSPGFVQAIQAATGEGVLEGVFPTEGGRIVGRIDSYQGVTDADWERDRDMFRRLAATQAEQEFVERYLDDAVARAKVVKHYNP